MEKIGRTQANPRRKSGQMHRGMWKTEVPEISDVAATGAIRRTWSIRVVATAMAIVAIGLVPHGRFSAALFFGVVVAWAVVLASQTSGRARDGLVLIAALFFTPAVLEVVYVAPRGAVYSGRLFGVDPVLGYAPLPSRILRARKLDAGGHTIFDVVYTTDKNGLRRTVSDPTGPTIAFFFDSLTFGEGVQDSDTLPQQFADLTGRRFHVLNLGAPAYGPQILLRTLETGFRDALLKPDPVLFVVQTAVWHAERAACRPNTTWPTPRYVVEAGRAVYRGTCVSGIEERVLAALDNSRLYTRLIRPLLVDRQGDIELYLAIFREAAALAEKKYGARLVILYLRSVGQFAGTDYNDDRIMAELRESGAIVVDATLTQAGAADLEISGDGHPTAKGHRLRAQLLWDIIQAGELVPESGGNAPPRQGQRRALGDHPGSDACRLLGAPTDRAPGDQPALPRADLRLQGADRVPGAGQHQLQSRSPAPRRTLSNA
jgi:hypothetical protein